MADHTAGAFLRGYTCTADYRKDEVVEEYKNNPLIEAFPKRLSKSELMERLFRTPYYNSDHRNLELEDRLELIDQIYDEFMQPLPVHIDLHRAIYSMIRRGYKGRNPQSPSYTRQFAIGHEKILKAGLDGNGRNLAGVSPTASTFSLVGLSGMGKTKSVENILLQYPQVISHETYKGEPFIRSQLVWLKIECPSSKSLKSLCNNFYMGIDRIMGNTNYYAQYSRTREDTIDKLSAQMSHVASLVNLGVLVIDEIQRVNKGASGGENRMIEFITELTNTFGVPIIIIGTFKAMYLYKKSMANIRRAIPVTYMEHIIDRMENDAQWGLFLGSLWNLQYTKTETILTKELSETMYHETQGVLDITVKLYMHIQSHAIIKGGNEQITPAIIREVARKSLQLLQPLFDRFRRGDTTAAEEEFEDLKPKWLELNDYIKKVDYRVEIAGILASEHKRALQQKDEQQIIKKLFNHAKQNGLDPLIAEQAANSVYQASQGMDNLDEMIELMNKQANEYRVTLEQKNIILSLPKQKNTKKIKPLLHPKDIRSIVLHGEEAGKTIAEALKESGYIKEYDEFL
ncbi:AAA domain-containing protein [Paenibacillus tianmuensis]|uniref:AAA domain-containing protein n=1 Tax=Paenibacillus tianmuensis TaxID=624147 RepID=A0A1G4TNV9_9BACL|nr:ATP-binding protein [Paenibacillus tianmuensis]SCW83100.1 AAA domain-containing protein [Paenibacillus tianmuensis]